jgi:FtsK/SpoIIIE family
MGPHGILIGATGSGKSELIRTLVLALAMSHSSERLNMVLVDFKGGATFLGLDGLPHVSALITNLADELPLVDRMADALQGELIRRQELLRAAGHASINDYEKARANGAGLAALPTLVVIVDEFGELLATKGEFMNLFVMIGRLGRSLGVHLLLASQRLEEGRIHALETHLSYRLGLRVFSSMESRAILGVTDAYDKPLSPGQGFLRTSTTSLEKFKAVGSARRDVLAGLVRQLTGADVGREVADADLGLLVDLAGRAKQARRTAGGGPITRADLTAQWNGEARAHARRAGRIEQAITAARGRVQVVLDQLPFAVQAEIAAASDRLARRADELSAPLWLGADQARVDALDAVRGQLEALARRAEQAAAAGPPAADPLAAYLAMAAAVLPKLDGPAGRRWRSRWPPRTATAATATGSARTPGCVARSPRACGACWSAAARRGSTRR